ncbi:hypothetical protein DMA11_24210 [Marinilabiliaceae bacterium JC017]|nr:hypothetical protein DMA11_24210 [Marinilabiliaceae bacterium JC017]
MISIDKTKCKNCHKCEAVCPTLSIDIESGSVNEDCIECYHCLATCKEQAITLDNTPLESNFQVNINPSEFELLMQKRRTYRKFTSRQVSKEVISEFIHRMRFTPTASNERPLQFSVVQTPETLNQINDITINVIKKTYQTASNPLASMAIRALYGKKTVDQLKKASRKFANKAASKPDMITYNAPALIVIHTKKHLGDMHNCDANIWTGMASLYAELLNLGTCINGYIVNAAKRHKGLKDLLGVPKDHTVHTAILIGYPKEKYHHQVIRETPPISWK